MARTGEQAKYIKRFAGGGERKRQLGRSSSKCKDITMHGTNNIKKM